MGNHDGLRVERTESCPVLQAKQIVLVGYCNNATAEEVAGFTLDLGGIDKRCVMRIRVEFAREGNGRIQGEDRSFISVLALVPTN